MIDHDTLCHRAVRWLRGRNCNPIFGDVGVTSNVCSCAERPDAIGWSSSYKIRGSIVIECKTSLSDFYADAKKFICYTEDGKAPDGYEAAWYRRYRRKCDGLIPVQLPSMGTFRYFMCEPGIITAEHIAKCRADHGLLYVTPRRVEIAVQAPRRDVVDLLSEVRLLRYAIINCKDNIGAIGAVIPVKVRNLAK